MKIVLISDTHGRHQQLQLPEGDMIIHAGDVSSRGTPSEIERFIEWYESLDYQYKIFIAGNHDFFFEDINEETLALTLPDSITYLNDSGITINGIKIWGSPITPRFHDWAFNRDRGENIRLHWDLIPTDTDILITHGPAAGILDETITHQNAGCEELKLVIEKSKIRFHVCGHIHEAYGSYHTARTKYINASVLDIRYNLVNDPVVISL